MACSQLPWPKAAHCLMFQLLQEGAEGGGHRAARGRGGCGVCLLGPCLKAGCRPALTCLHPLSVLCSSEDGIYRGELRP